MPRPIDFHLVDGFNLALSSGLVKTLNGPGNVERARAKVLGWLLARSAEPWRLRTTLVFDAQRYSVPAAIEHHAGLTVRFAVEHANADALLIELIRSHPAPRQLVVVSSDREIQQAARQRGARFVASPAWRDQVEQGILQAPPSDDEAGDDDARERAHAAQSADWAELLPPEILAQLAPPTPEQPGPDSVQ